MKNLVLITAACARTVSQDVHGAERAIGDRGITPPTKPFELQQVRLLDGPCKEIMKCNRR